MKSALSWVGDNIGVSVGQPITIDLQDQNGEHVFASVATTLLLINRITTDHRQRILSAIRHCAERGELSPDDLQAYRAWEADDESKGGRIPAGLQIGHVVGMLYSLHWAGKKCEAGDDFEQFHALALELMPRLGVELESATKTLGQICTGLFVEDAEVGHV